MEGSRERFEKFIDILSEEVEKDPERGVKELLAAVLLKFHEKRLPLSPEIFKEFFVEYVKRPEVSPDIRFRALLALDKALFELRVEELAEIWG